MSKAQGCAYIKCPLHMASDGSAGADGLHAADLFAAWASEPAAAAADAPAVTAEWRAAHAMKQEALARTMSFIMARLERVKRVDLKLAVDVMSYANCEVRDSSGNLLPTVWTRQAYNNEFENASLLTREALKRRLDEFISEGMAKNMPLLQQVNDPALLVDWVVRTTEHWERRYAQKRDEKYDISQVALSAMLEVVSEQVLPLLEMHEGVQLEAVVHRQLQHWRAEPGSNRVIGNIMQHVLLAKRGDAADLGDLADLTDLADLNSEQMQSTSFFWMHTGRHALVRLLFRSDVVPDLRERLCLLAGKLLQKKEVCNKAGSYASRQQRSDVMQEYTNAVLDFREWYTGDFGNGGNGRSVAAKLTSNMNGADFIYCVIDHTAVPVTFENMRAPAPLVRGHGTADAAVHCPECRHVFTLPGASVGGAGPCSAEGAGKRLRGRD